MTQLSVSKVANQGLYDRRTAGFQKWTCLTFIHWRVSAEAIQALLPQSLRVLEYDGTGWLGLARISHTVKVFRVRLV